MLPIPPRPVESMFREGEVGEGERAFGASEDR